MSLDPITRLRIIAAGLGDVVVVDALLAAPYASVWGLAGDLERGVPLFEPAVAAVEIVEQNEDRLRVVVETVGGLYLPMDVLLQDGYCLMQGEHVSIGMAARSEGDKTRFAHFERLIGSDPVREKKLLDELRRLEALARGDRQTSTKAVDADEGEAM